MSQGLTEQSSEDDVFSYNLYCFLKFLAVVVVVSFYVVVASWHVLALKFVFELSFSVLCMFSFLLETKQ
jgi:hypothetical protein